LMWLYVSIVTVTCEWRGFVCEILRGLDSCGASLVLGFLPYRRRPPVQLDIEGGLDLLLCVYTSWIT
jgi:hypothetical protein